MPMNPKPPDNSWLAFVHLGWIIALTMTAGLLGGHWLDRRLDTAPLFLLVGAGLGIFASGYSFYRAIRKLPPDAPGKAGKPGDFKPK